MHHLAPKSELQTVAGIQSYARFSLILGSQHHD
jgi:hypothetical protein